MYTDPMRLRQHGVLSFVEAAVPAEANEQLTSAAKFVTLSRVGSGESKSQYVVLPFQDGAESPEYDNDVRDAAVRIKLGLNLSHTYSGKGVNEVARRLARWDFLVPAPGDTELTMVGSRPGSFYMVAVMPSGFGEQHVWEQALSLPVQLTQDFLVRPYFARNWTLGVI